MNKIQLYGRSEMAPMKYNKDLPEQSPNKSRGEIARNTPGKCAISKEACLTETVAAREGQCVCTRQDQSNGYERD